MKPHMLFAGAVVALTAWIVLAFIVAIPSGWVHLLLAVGATLIAVGLVKQAPGGGGQESG